MRRITVSVKRQEREIRSRTQAFSASGRLASPTWFSYWDSAIVAAARALGCDRIYTEDLSHGQIVEGVAIVDPFR